MTHDEYKGLLTIVSATTMHAILSNSKPESDTDKIVAISVNLAQQLLDEVDDAVENG